MTVAVRRLLLDALKPREVSIIELAKALGLVDKKGEVEIIISEVDSKTETIKVTIKGSNIDNEAVSRIMDHFGVSVRGVDEVNVSRE
jgi:uncharacterized protein